MTKAEAIVAALAIVIVLFGLLWRSYAPHGRSSRDSGESWVHGGDAVGESGASHSSDSTGDCGWGDGGDCGGGDGGGGDGGGGD